MKQTMQRIALILSALMLLTFVSACGRRQEILNQIESEKAAESAAEESSVITMGGGRETIAPSPDTQSPDEPTDTSNPDAPPDTTTPDDPQETYKPPVPTVPDPNDKYPTNAGYQLTAGINKGGNGYYKGVTVEELEQRFECFIDPFVEHINTPTGMIFMQNNKDTTYYNKLTGNVSHICPDPLCRHKDCIWADMQQFEFVSQTHIYFRANDVLWRSDMNRNHVEELGINMATAENKVLYEDGNLVYMQYLIYKENGAGEFAFAVFDCTTKEIKIICDEGNMYLLAVTGGDTVWFWKNFPDDTVIYKADLNFTHQEKALTTDTSMSILMANDEYLLIGEGGGYPASYLYHIETGKKIELPENLHTSSYPTLTGKYVYYAKDMTDAELAISPLKDFYGYVPNPTDAYPFRAGLINSDGRIYRMNLETGEEELCAEISYNGIPIRIVALVADGDAIYISYLTYKDWHNFYNQEYGKREDGTMSYYTQEPYRYMYVDMTNGTVNLIDPNRIG